MRTDIEDDAAGRQVVAFAPGGTPVGAQAIPAVVLNAQVERLSDLAGGNAPPQFGDAEVVAEDEADLMDKSAGLGGVGHRAGLLDVHAERFLAQDVLAVREREQALLTMKAVRCHDCDSVDVVARADVAEVCGDGRHPESGRHRLRARRIAAAQSHHLGVRMRLNLRQVAVGGKCASADHGDP